jgi:hypothetical protein
MLNKINRKCRGKDKKPRRYGSGTNPNSHPKGRHHTEASKKKISEHCGRPCTQERKDKIGNANRGDKSGLWKGDNIGYKAVHLWLKVNFGKANRCEAPLRLPIQPCSNKYEWALKRNKKCERKRENFFMSCTSCHKTYDKIINNIKKYKR